MEVVSTSFHLIYGIVDLCHPSLDYLTLLQIAGGINSKYDNLSSLLDGQNKIKTKEQGKLI